MSKKKKRAASKTTTPKKPKSSQRPAGKTPARVVKTQATGIPGSRQQRVWDYLDRNGFDEALVYFEGGGDDGAAYKITLMRAGEAVDELDANVPLNLRDAKDPPIAWLLQEPIYEAYIFEGDHHLEDVITWSAKTRRLDIPDNDFMY